MTLPPLAQVPCPRPHRRALNPCILFRGAIEQTVPPGEVKAQDSSQDDARTRKSDIRNISLPVHGPLAARVEVRCIDGRQVGPGVDDGVRDGPLA